MLHVDRVVTAMRTDRQACIFCGDYGVQADAASRNVLVSRGSGSWGGPRECAESAAIVLLLVPTTGWSPYPSAEEAVTILRTKVVAFSRILYFVWFISPHLLRVLPTLRLHSRM